MFSPSPRRYLASTKIPLWTLLTIPFLLQLLVAVGLVGYFSYQSGQRSVNELANHLMEEVTVRVHDRLDAYLQLPQNLVELNRGAIVAGALDSNDFAALEQRFFEQIQTFDLVSTVEFGSERGEFLAVGRDKVGTIGTPGSIVVWDKRGTNPRQFYQIDAKHHRLKVLHTTPNYDPRPLHWYQTALKAGKPTWTPVFFPLRIPTATMAAVAPVYQDDQLQGVLMSNVLLSHVSLFLNSLHFSPTGQVFIVERSGAMVATSTEEKPFLEQGSGREPQRLWAVDSHNPLTCATTQTMIEQWTDLHQIRSTQRFEFTHQGQRQFGQVVPYQDGKGLDWLLVIVVPESDFMAEIYANNRHTLLLCGLTLILAAGTGILTTRRLVAPMRRLQQAADTIAEGQFDYPIETSRIREMAQLSDTFQQMAQQLNHFFQSLQTSEQELEHRVSQRTTELQRSEKRFRRAFDYAPIGIALISLDGQFLKVNRVLCGISGYAEAELLALPIQHLMNPADGDAHLASWRQRLTDETHSYQVEQQWHHKQGHLIPIALSVSLIQDQEHHPLYFVAQIEDISDRHEIDRLKDEFVSIISHELRTPLTAIRGSLGMLESGLYANQPDKAQQMLQLALKNSDRLVRLVNDILDLERLKSGKVELLMEACDAADLMQQAVEAVQTIADEANIHLSWESTHVQIWADPSAIVQTLTNLLGNAIKFSPDGSTVWLRVEQVNGESVPSNPDSQLSTPFVLFSVRDQGRGIPADKLESIFNQFQQVDVSDSRQKGGTGLGLAICEKIVKQHRGHIWVKSMLGAGSTFYFTIPLPSP